MDPIISIRPSQWTNIGWVILGIVLFFFIIPPIYAIYKILEVYSTQYDFYDDIIRIRKGVFNVNHKEVSYFRIKSIQIDEPLLYRIVGIGNVHVVTSDKYAGEVEFMAINSTEEFVEGLREMVGRAKIRMGMVEYDLFDL